MWVMFSSKFSNFTMHKSQIKLSQVRGEAKRNGLKQFFLHPTTTKIFWLIVTPFSTAILVVITPHWCNFSPEDQFSNAAGPAAAFFLNNDRSANKKRYGSLWSMAGSLSSIPKFIFNECAPLHMIWLKQWKILSFHNVFMAIFDHSRCFFRIFKKLLFAFIFFTF